MSDKPKLPAFPGFILGHAPSQRETDKLIEQSRHHVMSDSEKEAQRQSFAKGNSEIDKQGRTTQMLPILKRPDDLGMGEAFARDPFLEAKFRALVKEYGIQTIIETGTWRGYTARRMAEFVSEVFTIEADHTLYEMAEQALYGSPANVMYGDSRTLLRMLIQGSQEYDVDTPILYYLDAHWGVDWPLFEELDIIAANDPRCVIVIHDIQVPGTDFKFDTYNGKALTFDLIKPHLDKLQFPWRHEYNTETAGHRCGALFITPKE